MLKSQFDYLCETFGDPSIPVEDRWKAIRYIYIENPLMDVQFLLKNNEIMYSDNENIGPGFYILGAPNAELEPINKGSVITYIPLSMIDKISFNTTYIDTNIAPANVSRKNTGPIIEGTSFNNTDSYSTIAE